MVELKRALSLIPMVRIAVITRAMTNAGKLKPISTPKMWGAFTRSCARCTSSGECGRKNLHGLIQKGLRSRNQRRIGGLRHLASNDFLSLGNRRPMIVGQPERHFDVEDVQQFNEVIRPARRNRAGAHGVLEGQIPANDPREDFAERRVRIGIGAACERNHRGKLRVAERGKCAAQVPKARRRASIRGRRNARPIRTERRCRRR